MGGWTHTWRCSFRELHFLPYPGCLQVLGATNPARTLFEMYTSNLPSHL